MDEVSLNWAEATVDDAQLSVPLEGELPEGWEKSFERTVRLLGTGEWGAVELGEQTVSVAEVPQGDEDKLRHYLESVVEQANAAHRPDESEDDGDEQGRQGPDAEMTERFRSFASEDEPAR
jgi:hypothetical protein